LKIGFLKLNNAFESPEKLTYSIFQRFRPFGRGHGLIKSLSGALPYKLSLLCHTDLFQILTIISWFLSDYIVVN
jgi:hypothetical protein